MTSCGISKSIEWTKIAGGVARTAQGQWRQRGEAGPQVQVEGRNRIEFAAAQVERVMTAESQTDFDRMAQGSVAAHHLLSVSANRTNAAQQQGGRITGVNALMPINAMMRRWRRVPVPQS